jgi:hypothetical protein
VIIVVVIPPAIAVAITVAIPVMIMVEAAAVTVPVTAVELAALIARSDPCGAGIRRPSPISSVPTISMAYRIPITVDPIIIRARGNGANTHHAGTWWRTNSNSHGYLRTVGRRSCQKHSGKHRGQDIFFHVRSPLLG